MHCYGESLDDFATSVFAFARARAAEDLGGVGLGIGRTPAELDAAGGTTVTAEGLGADEVLRIFTEVVEPACLSVDFPRYLAFVPAAPTEVAILADLVVSACSMYGGSWQEGAGAVWAENQALRWLADLAGLPPEAGGCFVAGGTSGNLSALVAARHSARHDGRLAPSARPVVVAGTASHSSVRSAADVMDAELVVVPGERLDGAALAEVLARPELAGRVVAVVATAGSTNLGRVDDLATVADACAAAGVWLHVDGAYGGAALAAPSARPRFAGIERADSFIVDPHKWLFAPYDCCALLYRDPELGRRAHTQHAAYLEVLADGAPWNPSDFAIHLTRRARGLPFWFSLAAYGTDAYALAVEHCLGVVREAAALVKASSRLSLVCEPELSVLAFRREGWTADDYARWSDDQLRTGASFVVPSAHDGEPILRLCVVNPRTTLDDLAGILASL
jgi:glutamate/tyrosine decarboxylase-like PLP-dependent enzyme